MVRYFEKEQGHHGDPRVDCGCNYCRPLMIAHWKQHRKDTAKLRSERFAFVREVIKRDLIIDDSTIDQSLDTIWADIIGNNVPWTNNKNVILVPALLERFGRYKAFDLNRMKPETQDYVRNMVRDIFGK